jgi:hypothetical protein
MAKRKAMKRILMTLIGLTGFSIIFTSCTKDPVADLSAEETRIYITDHDSSVNFSNYTTYSISDSVAVIENGKSSHELTDVGQAYIDAVKKYMNAAGYQMVAKDDNPDLGVDVNHITNTSTGVISYGDYWSNYGGYWDPYYWGYPDYGYYIPYAYSIYQIKEGALSVDILDLKNASEDHKINVVWTGMIRGSGILNAGVADSQVKALFDQSSYLKH